MRLVLNQAVLGNFALKNFDTDYQPIMGRWRVDPEIPYRLRSVLDDRIRKIRDVMLEQDPTVLLAVLVDKNGYAPTHNTRYSQPLTGDPEKDRTGNRTKQMFNDPVGIAAARFDGSDGQQVLRQEYLRDTGERAWDVAAPVYVQGKHWGAFRVGFSVEEVERAVAELRNSHPLHGAYSGVRLHYHLRRSALLHPAAQPADAGCRTDRQRTDGGDPRGRFE
jgi:hypothetical protein